MSGLRNHLWGAGLIGTVVGFVAGLLASTVVTSDTMVGLVFLGLTVAFITTTARFAYPGEPQWRVTRTR